MGSCRDSRQILLKWPKTTASEQVEHRPRFNCSGELKVPLSNALDASKPVLLVAEDDESVRDAVALVLSGQGYEVASTSSGEEAVDLIGVCSHLVGLFTDIQLGGEVTGWKVGELFHRKWPTKPIVYASARCDVKAYLEPTAVFLRKPFQLPDLIAALTTVPRLGSEGARCQP